MPVLDRDLVRQQLLGPRQDREAQREQRDAERDAEERREVVAAGVAEFERELIRERTTAGLAAARARGRTGGRPTVMTPDKLRTARRMYDQREMTVEQIATVLGVSRTTVYRALTMAPPAPPTLSAARPKRPGPEAITAPAMCT